MYGNQVLVAHESDDFQVVERWEPVTEVDVQTPLDVYKELAGEACGAQDAAPDWHIWGKDHECACLHAVL